MTIAGKSEPIDTQPAERLESGGPEPAPANASNAPKDAVEKARVQPRERMRVLANRTWQDALTFTLNLGVLVLILVFVGLLAAATFQRTTEIDLISAPKTFAEEKGYSPDVTARELEDAFYDVLAVLTQPAEASRTRTVANQPRQDRSADQDRTVDAVVSYGQLPIVAVISDRPAIVVPGVGVSIDSLASMIRGFLCPSCRKIITGEFTNMGGRLWLRIRANNHVVYVNEQGGDPNQPDVLLRQAAIKLLDSANPGTGAIAYNNFGNVKYRAGKIDEAITEYRAALGLDPKATFAYYNLGNALRTQGHLDEAITTYRAATQIETKDAKMDAKIHTNLGIVLADQ